VTGRDEDTSQQTVGGIAGQDKGVEKIKKKEKTANCKPHLIIGERGGGTRNGGG